MAPLRGGEQVYATLLLNDTYLPGALVLAHSLRDAGTSKQLVVLVTLDTVSAEVITELKAVYDHVIPVPRIRNARPANLYLMNRPDLHSAFTKVNLWRQTQFSKIVYIDADVVAYRAPDELFDIAAPFSAAPDIGWPDLFNTGVMVLSPNMGDYYALMAMAERGISFDGADQGLLNMHFKNTYNRISFTYNVTPSAHYQYVPAYRHFQSSINMVHFIGPDKPWFQGRQASKGDSPFEDMIGRWWAVYDRHYRVAVCLPTWFSFLQNKSLRIHRKQHLLRHKSSSHRFRRSILLFSSSRHIKNSRFLRLYSILLKENSSRKLRKQHQRVSIFTRRKRPVATVAHTTRRRPLPRVIRLMALPTMMLTMLALPSHVFITNSPIMVKDPSLRSRIRLAIRYPLRAIHLVLLLERKLRLDQSRFQHMRGGVNQYQWSNQESQLLRQHGTLRDSRPEALNFPSQTYEMSQDPAPFVPPQRYPSPPRNMWYEVPKDKPTQKPRHLFPWEINQPKPTRVFTADLAEPEAEESSSTPTGEHAASFTASSTSQAPAEPSLLGSSTTGQKSEPSTPATPTIKVSPSDPWTAFTRTNAWDEVPEIERYVEGLQKHRRGKSQGSVGISDGKTAKEHGLKLTDFPSVVDRPSLPVTPAPIRRPKFWGGGPKPGDGEDDEELPVAQGVPPQTDWDPSAQLQELAKQQSEALLKKLGGGEGGPEGSSKGVVLSPQPVKGSATTSVLRNLGGEQAQIQEPAYQGPGTAWERGEGAPLWETPALPTEEQRDVLDT
ncbi:glycosyl transferase family 8 [Colletotrichum scovillei]|uniref:glycogenin glucosyltransferase n=1 Tax=Colletotrichum scovillei TaxID=1209932 RepID=A0A9P7RFE0_9PEZI|nr:glycosyl transferase family 8 [Colletotrichum scovillei]KAG7075099.1 glycosyl transferase family 8 [Colletotrichum scovillei]KAG7082374.1 glycosyl transferase family 8 [Colletotrichum scovillei]